MPDGGASPSSADCIARADPSTPQISSSGLDDESDDGEASSASAEEESAEGADAPDGGPVREPREMSSIEYDATSDDFSDASAAGFAAESSSDGVSGARVLEGALEEGAEGAGEESGAESGEESGEGEAGGEDASSGDTESGSGEERSPGAPGGSSGRACWR